MKLRSILATALVGSALFAGSAFAQQGELIISPTYIKAGCTGWEFKEGGSTGAPSGNYPRSYQIFAVSCNGGYVAKKTQVFYGNGSLYSCRIDLMNTAIYTLSSDSCTSFEVRTKGTPPSTVVPAAPTYAYIGNVGGCGALPAGAVCPAPQYWVTWPAVQHASSYEYSFIGTQPYAGSTTATSITIPFGYNPTSGKVRACNANNQCSNWTTVTPPPQ